MKTVFVNPERCVGCRQCEFACAVEHSLSREPTQAVFESPAPRPRIHVTPGRAYATSFPNKCRHCDPAPCEQVCPTGAIARDHERGLVQSDARRCIACAMCAMVCPFDVISFHEFADGRPARIAALKCDGCVERIDAGREPACVEACKSGALVFGEINQLIEAGRLRDTTALLSAAAATPMPASAMPEGISGWRAWGEAATHLNEGVHHGHH